MLQPVQRFVGVQGEVVQEAGGDPLHHADVRSGGEEPLAATGQNDDVDVVVEPRLHDGVVELAHHVERVRVRRRIVELDEANPILDAIVHQSPRLLLLVPRLLDTDHGRRHVPLAWLACPLNPGCD